MANYSIVEYLGESNDGKCGYCKTTGRYNSHGFWAHTLNVDDYQSLINRNWRRSGQYCYLPKNADTCCPMYTIKSDAMTFKLNKSHKKILKRMKKFLRDGIKDKNIGHDDDEGSSEAQEPKPSKEPSNIQIHDINVSSIQPKINPKVNLPAKVAKPVQEKTESLQSESDKPSNPKKAKLIRLERKIEKLAAKGQTLDDVHPKRAANAEKTLEDFLAEESTIDGKHRLEVKLVSSKEGSEKSIFNLYKKYQMHVHHDSPDKLIPRSYERFLVNSPLQVNALISF